MAYDPTGQFNWGKLFNGASLLAIGITACAAAVTVVTAGACTPDGNRIYYTLNRDKIRLLLEVQRELLCK